MGFGTLFIGYFFLLNFPYCEFTDALAAVAMLYALYKLSGVNRAFRIAALCAVGFLAFGIFELSVELFSMLSPMSSNSLLFTISASVRHVSLALLTVFMMLGIRDVAEEVKLYHLSEKSMRATIVSVVVYSLSVLLESTLLALFIPAKVLAWLYVFITLATLTLIVFNLTCIYSAYSRICMPDDKDMEEKESKIGFINAFRKHEEEKSREYAEYKLQKFIKKQEKKKNGSKK